MQDEGDDDGGFPAEDIDLVLAAAVELVLADA